MIFAQLRPHFHKASTPIALECKITVKKKTYFKKYPRKIKNDENTPVPKNVIPKLNFGILSSPTSIFGYMKPSVKFGVVSVFYEKMTIFT